MKNFRTKVFKQAHELMRATGKAFAVSVLVLIPAVIVFLAGQDYLEQGIISTAIKE